MARVASLIKIAARCDELNKNSISSHIFNRDLKMPGTIQTTNYSFTFPSWPAPQNILGKLFCTTQYNMVLQSPNWCFTLNNYSSSDVDRLNNPNLLNDVQYLIFGKEISGTGTPHLQGFVKFRSRKRMRGAKAILGDVHLSVARSVQKSIEYCKKDDDFTEIGEIVSTQGKRNDLDVIKEEVELGNWDLDYYIVHHPEVWSRCSNWIRSYIGIKRKQKFTEQIVAKPLWIWQSELYSKLEGPVHDRKISFYVDYKGDRGKSWFARYYYARHPATTQLLEPGPKKDLSHAFNEDSRVVFLDVPRAKVEYFPYDFLESLKNGYVFSMKYDSHMKFFAPCHVVVFMNEPPNEAKLSIDRYDITILTDENCQTTPAVGENNLNILALAANVANEPDDNNTETQTDTIENETDDTDDEDI